MTHIPGADFAGDRWKTGAVTGGVPGRGRGGFGKIDRLGDGGGKLLLDNYLVIETRGGIIISWQGNC